MTSPMTSGPVMEDAEAEEQHSLLRTQRHKSIRKVREWQQKECDNMENRVVMLADQPPLTKARPVFRGRTPSYEALRCAVTELHRIDDFDSERLGEGFFSEVFKILTKYRFIVLVQLQLYYVKLYKYTTCGWPLKVPCHDKFNFEYKSIKSNYLKINFEFLQ